MQTFSLQTNKRYLLVYLLLLIKCHLVSCISPLWDSVRTNIYQEYDVQEGNDILTVRINMGEYKSTDLVVGEDIRWDSRLILTCIAHHGPAEWVYSGDGSPNFVTNTTTENLSASGKRLPLHDMNGAKRYVATLLLGQKGMTKKDTGRYNCLTGSPDSGMKFKTLSAFYHLYVPANNKLFIRKSETVKYDLNKSAARIPCGVTNPKASVTLQKFVNGKLEFIAEESMLYHPISGFYPKKNIQGSYICTAAFNDTFDFVHFTLLPIPSSGAKTDKTDKKPSRYTKPEDLEWLMYPSVTTRRPRPTPTPSFPTLPLSNNKKSSSTPYVPFHLRYTTTYGPFQTFFNIHTTASTTAKTPYDANKKLATVKTKPFNAASYPQDLFEKDKETIQSDIPEGLISYRPLLHPLTKTPNYSSSYVHNQRPANEGTTASTRIRTTPRKYRPYTIPTTVMPIVIPESIICLHFSCGTNAICVASMVYNQTQGLNAEPICKCLPNFKLGNPYLQCYAPTKLIDPNLLYFNLSSFARTPILPEPINSESELHDDSSVDENYPLKTTIVDIIDM